jgi:hypothetical protein
MAAAAAAVALAGLAASAASAETALLTRAAAMVDIGTGAVVRGESVRIRGGHIMAVGPQAVGMLGARACVIPPAAI